MLLKYLDLVFRTAPVDPALIHRVTKRNVAGGCGCLRIRIAGRINPCAKKWHRQATVNVDPLRLQLFYHSPDIVIHRRIDGYAELCAILFHTVLKIVIYTAKTYAVGKNEDF